LQDHPVSRVPTITSPISVGTSDRPRERVHVGRRHGARGARLDPPRGAGSDECTTIMIGKKAADLIRQPRG
jgi:hypothetical protein